MTNNNGNGEYLNILYHKLAQFIEKIIDLNYWIIDLNYPYS